MLFSKENINNQTHFYIPAFIIKSLQRIIQNLSSSDKKEESP
jgi:hypothetical protein